MVPRDLNLFVSMACHTLALMWGQICNPTSGGKKTTCVEKGFNRHRSWWGLTGEDSGFLFFASVFGP